MASGENGIDPVYIFEILAFVKRTKWLRHLIFHVEMPCRKFCSKVTTLTLQQIVDQRWVLQIKGRPHNLPARLIVSLTSHPKRFKTLPLTIKCLATQTVRPDRIILWVAHQDKNELTEDILALQNSGIEIAYCEDLKSYKKLIPTLTVAPDAFIVTADDDLYYRPTWLEELSSAYTGNNKEVICHRAHTIRLDAVGNPISYKDWELDTIDNVASPLIFPTSGAGVLFPPNALHPDATAAELFMTHCPRADDVWLYWMLRLAGCNARKIGCKYRLIEWPGTEESALWLGNVLNGENDVQIRTMMNRYGFPRNT